MVQNNQNDAAKAFMLSAQATEMTSQVLRRLIREHIENPLPYGKTTLAKLAEDAGGKLEKIEISDKNIGDFNAMARKYNITYALKKDSNTDPPTWFVFFKQDKPSQDFMEKAFKEYTTEANESPVITAEGIKDVDVVMPREKSEQERESQVFEPQEPPEPPDR